MESAASWGYTGSSQSHTGGALCTKNYLAIDIGASSGRHIVGMDGERRSPHRGSVPFFPIASGGWTVIWNGDIDSLFVHVKQGIREAFAKYPEIESLSIDTWAVDYVLLKDGQPLSPVYAYRDNRTQAVLNEVHSILPFENLYARTGIQFQPLQQHLSAVCRQNSRAAGAGRGLFDDPGIPAVEAVRREGAGVHQRHLHRACERPDQGV